LAGVAAGALTTALIGYQLNYSRRHAIVGQVNGHLVYRADLDEQKTLFDRRAFELLCMTEVVKQEASRLQISPPQESAEGGGFEGLDQRVTDTLDQISLHGLSEEYLQRLYRLFSVELARYDLDYCYCLGPQNQRTFLDEWKDTGNFRDARAHSGVDAERLDRKLLKGVTLQQIQQMLGPKAYLGLVGRPAGQISAPIPFGDGVLFLHIDRIRQSFPEVRGDLRTLVALSRRRSTLHRLVNLADIQSELPALRQYRKPQPFEDIPVSGASELAAPAELAKGKKK